MKIGEGHRGGGEGHKEDVRTIMRRGEGHRGGDEGHGRK